MNMKRTQEMMAGGGIPPEKRAAKVRNTKQGITLVVFGLVLCAFSLAMVAITETFDKWMMVPCVLGFMMGVVGATVWSGELVSAAFRDIASLLVFWRRPV